MTGERIFLTPLEKEHIEIIRNWRNDSIIRKFFFSWQFINKAQQERWFEKYCSDETQVVFAIIDSNTKELIGTIGLSKIDHFHQRAELGTLIGNKKYWNKGYATESLKLLLNYAFNELNLNKVYSYVLKDNFGSIKKNKNNGFKIEGNLREHAFNQGKFQDVVIMGILKKDFMTLNK